MQLRTNGIMVIVIMMKMSVILVSNKKNVTVEIAMMVNILIMVEMYHD